MRSAPSARAVRWTVACLWAGLLASCAAPDHAPGSAAPRDFALSMSARFADQRYTAFELDRHGRLSYAGGRDAIHRRARPVADLDDAQRQALWDLVAAHRLFQARGRARRDARVNYRLGLRAGGFSHTLLCADDDVPGVGDLHDRLFAAQAEVRYGNQVLP